MDPAIMGALIIACCFAAGTFARNESDSKGRERADRTARTASDRTVGTPRHPHRSAA